MAPVVALVLASCAPLPVPSKAGKTTVAPKRTATTTTTVALASTMALTTAAAVVTAEPANDVLDAVAASLNVDRLPADLTPSLAKAGTDFENLDVTGCSKQDRDPSLGRCAYGHRMARSW